MMRTQRSCVLLALLMASPLLLSACPEPKPEPVIREPTTLPPQAKVVIETCPRGQYLRGGRHLWRNNRWNWENPRCTPKPGSWRDGCVWIRGRWSRSGSRIIYHRGRIRCPGDPDRSFGAGFKSTPPPARVAPPARPTRLPPAPPSGSIGCAPDQYLQVGHYVWKEGTWRWVTGRCAPRPAHWKQGCKWTRGRWSKTPTGFTFTKGSLSCP